MSKKQASGASPPYCFSEITVTAQHVVDELAGLTNSEREVVMALRRVDFWRAGKARDAGIHWSGSRVRVGVEEQAGYG